jgi:C-terminal processing protease CtpA/Prc
MKVNCMESDPIRINPNLLAEVIGSLSQKLRAVYVIPELATQLCDNLQNHLDNGDYTDLKEGELLALALTIHLQEVSHDEHLWVRWHPELLPEDEHAMRKSQDWQAERKLEAQLDNYGLHRVERLPGNVGYLYIRYFHRPAWAGETAVAAMNFLSNVSVWIIDLRHCTGGYPGMIALVSSFFFGEESIHLNSVYWRDDDTTQQFWTLPYIPGRRHTDQPVYILTSRETFSGGEEFADIFQSRRRATVIGEKTDGGAHPGASYSIHPHFEAFIPIGHAINPVTGKNWQGNGIVPDICVPQEQAFEVAYRLALDTVLATLGETPAGPYKRLAQEIRNVRDLKRRSEK